MNTSDYLDLDFTDFVALLPQSRRDFFKQTGGGIFIFLALEECATAQQSGRQRAIRPQLPTDFNAFLRIGEDGRVTCFTGKVELGQGIITSLAQMLAEELEVSLEVVDMVMGDTDLCPWDMGTFGSMSTRFFGPPLRAAAAEAKAVLIELAAESLNLPQSRLVAKNGAVFDQQNSEQRRTYAQLAQGKKIARRLNDKPRLQSVAEFNVMGTSVNRRDALEKVTGRAQYAGDVRFPGLLYARLLRPPAHGAKLQNVDTAPAKEIEGVQIVQESDFIAVLHELPDRAERGLSRIKAQFNSPESKVNDQTIFEHLLKAATSGNAVAQGGKIEDGRQLARQTFEKTYLNSYVAHAAMETHTAVARVEGDKATVWPSTQTPFSVQTEVAQALGFPQQNVRVITPFVGGGFGGKSRNTQAVEAARLAKITGRPVQVAWSRAEEFFYDTFRPAAIVKINSGIDEAGKIAFWDYDVFYAGDRGAPHFYAIPHHRTVAHGGGWGSSPGTHPFATGAWRAPGNNTNSFARESQIDIMAVAAGLNPVEFRLRNMSDPRMIRVLQAAASQFGSTPAKAPSGRGIGVACGIDSGTYVATLVEVAVDASKGTVQVKRVVCAQDMGVVVNPAGARIQMEGCITMGLGYSLTEEIHFQNGQITEKNFDTYELPRFSWLPKIETVFVENNEVSPQGGGEPAIIVMGAVIANAIHDATGARLYQLPLTPERVRAALKKT